jgi:DNA-binding CsgD family transcriptional regulator
MRKNISHSQGKRMMAASDMRFMDWKNENARKRQKVDEFSTSHFSPWLIGNEVPHLLSRNRTSVNDSFAQLLDLQNKALREMLGDYHQQIGALSTTLQTIRHSLIQLQQHTATLLPYSSKLGIAEVDIHSSLAKLVHVANGNVSKLNTPESVNSICILIKNNYPQLSPTESKIAAYIMSGLETTGIAAACSISERTVENHRLHIRQKLRINGKRNIRVFLQSSLRIKSSSMKTWKMSSTMSNTSI